MGFSLNLELSTPANYVVFFNEAWGRWIAAFDINELTKRPNSTGGYVGIFAANNFYSY